ncbi:MAG: leucyl/phenylalanyl-tRNA--protein transferase [Spirochaetia bacterium]
MENSNLPYFDEDTYVQFPPVDRANEYGIVAAEGNLSPGMLLSAYRQGIFPWYDEDNPILWWSPDPRFVLFPSELHVSKTMRKILRRGDFSVTTDYDFPSVIKNCAEIPRRHESGTWIIEEMQEAYNRLHSLGYAHSVEVWEDREKEGTKELVGGLYGVSLGSLFFGESMFSRRPNASKIGFILFATALYEHGFSCIDCQVYTDHLSGFGARDIPRKEYMELLSRALTKQTIRGSWAEWLDLEKLRRRRFAKKN